MPDKAPARGAPAPDFAPGDGVGLGPGPAPGRDLANPDTRTPIDPIPEARRQIEICNACRYCEGYCAVFPAITRQRAFADGDIAHLANLCHNCRGCYYACQYTEPHEFALNLPAALAEVRQVSWKDHAWPSGFARLFDRGGVAVAAALVVGFALILAALGAGNTSGDGAGGDGARAGFYAYLSHAAMVAIFAPAFLLPLGALTVSLRRYWASAGVSVSWSALGSAFASALGDAGRLRQLSGGAAGGCNYEDADRFSQARRHAHQATLWGFLLCFASTSSGTVLHYGFGLEAPYQLFSLPKLLGVPGGILLCLGTAGLAALKLKAERHLGAAGVWGGEMAFTLLLFAVSATGLALYAGTGTGAVPGLLAVHLGCVLALFLLIPYSKMVHGAYRLAALTAEAARRTA